MEDSTQRARAADEDGELWRERVSTTVAAVRERIAAAAARAGRDPSQIRLVAVTKTHPPQAVTAVLEAGVVDIGENRAAELSAKAAGVEALRPDLAGTATRPVWHFLGKLQTGTVRHVADVADVVQSAEPGAALVRLARRRAAAGQPIDVLIEVDFTGERQGVAPPDVGRFAEEISGMEGLRLRGLMTIAPITPAPEGARPFFARLRSLGEALRSAHPEAGDLSMGMSVDYEIGVEEGATMVRVGTALFGPRAPRT